VILIETYLPILIAAVSIGGAAVTYAYQKRVDRQTTLLEMRRSTYRIYLQAFYAMTDNRNGVKEIIDEHLRLKSDLMLVGSDRVIQSVGALSRYYSDTNSNGPDRDLTTVKNLVANLIIAMRADCFESSGLKFEEIQTLVPIV
jgi:hypothetical protein